MAKVKTSKSSETPREIRPAIIPENRENRMISLAMDLVEKRLIEGTATSQETTHFLKQATAKHRLEMEKLELEKELTKAKTESLQSSKKMEELYMDAIKAMQRYGGHGDSDDI